MVGHSSGTTGLVKTLCSQNGLSANFADWFRRATPVLTPWKYQEGIQAQSGFPIVADAFINNSFLEYECSSRFLKLTVSGCFSEEDAQAAFVKMNGRWFAGKQLSCQFTSVNKWQPAICGKLFTSGDLKLLFDVLLFPNTNLDGQYYLFVLFCLQVYFTKSVVRKERIVIFSTSSKIRAMSFGKRTETMKSHRGHNGAGL